MGKVVLKKTLYISGISVDESTWKNYVDENKPEVEREIYWLYEVWPLSIKLDPIGWTCFDSLKELNKALWTKYKEKDIWNFERTLIEKDKVRSDFKQKTWFYKK